MEFRKVEFNTTKVNLYLIKLWLFQSNVLKQNLNPCFFTKNHCYFMHESCSCPAILPAASMRPVNMDPYCLPDRTAPEKRLVIKGKLY